MKSAANWAERNYQILVEELWSDKHDNETVTRRELIDKAAMRLANEVQADAVDSTLRYIKDFLALGPHLKPSPVEHKKCPGCGKEPESDSFMDEGDLVFIVQCTKPTMCFRTHGCDTEAEAWAIWDKRSGANG